MELREMVEDATGDDSKLKQLLQENKKRMDKTLKELSDAFQNSNFNDAIRLTATLQYWNRIHETIEEKIGYVD
jgi:DnaJ-domain-containing protein 1